MGVIYSLSDPRTGELRYVGKTSRKPGERLRDHVKLAKYNRHHTASWIKSLLADGVKPEMELLEKVDDVGLNEAERFWISQFRALGFRLTNSTEGGDGVMQGRRHSAETREKMSKSQKGRPHPWKKSPHTVEERRRVAATMGTKPFRDQHGNLYFSLMEAARAIGTYPSNVSRALNGIHKHVKGYYLTREGL